MTTDTRLPTADEQRPRHPVYGLATRGTIRTVDGVAFHPFRIGVNRYAAATPDGRLEVRGGFGSPYRAFADGEWLAAKFLKFETAAKAAIKARKP
jgi:hypothetical protein